MKRNKAYHLYAEHQERPQNRNTAGNAPEIKHIEVWTIVTHEPQQLPLWTKRMMMMNTE